MLSSRSVLPGRRHVCRRQASWPELCTAFNSSFLWIAFAPLLLTVDVALLYEISVALYLESSLATVD